MTDDELRAYLKEIQWTWKMYIESNPSDGNGWWLELEKLLNEKGHLIDDRRSLSESS